MVIRKFWGLFSRLGHTNVGGFDCMESRVTLSQIEETYINTFD